MNTLLKNLVKIIGLKKLVSFAWGLAYEELKKVTDKSQATWDDQVLSFLDETIKDVIESLST